MKRSMRRLAAVGGSVLLAAGVVSAQHAAPVARPAIPHQQVQQQQQQQQPEMSQEDQQVQQLLNKLTEISNQISRDAQSPQTWRYQVAQAEVMLHLASHSKGKEREDWLKMVIDAYYSAAVAAPESDPSAYRALQMLPAHIARTFPESKTSSYAVLQEIQADYMRVLSKSGDDPTKAQLHLRDRLLRFAQENPNVAEAPKAVMEAAQLCESMKKVDDARRCYHYVAQRYPGTPMARKAMGVEWRLGEGSAQVSLPLPYVYATSSHGDQAYDIKEARGKLVVVYFWTSTTPEAHGDFAALKVLTDRYQFKGLEVVYVNLDDDPLAVRDFLSGKLTSGVHLHQKGGLESETAHRYGIKALPEAFLVGQDGTLLKHSLKVGELEREVGGHLQKGK